MADDYDRCGPTTASKNKPSGTKHKTKPATRALTASSTPRTCREPGASRLRVDARCLLLGFVARLEGDPPMSGRAPMYPATMVVHWPSGPVPCCDKHGQELVGLGGFLGSHIVATRPTEPAECGNCVNDALQADRETERS